MKKSILADISMFMTAIFWGGGFVAVKDALNNVSPFYMMSIRFTFAFLILSVIFLKRIKALKKKDLINGFIVGIFLFAGFAAQTIGMKYTTAGKNAFLTATNVVMVPFLYWIVKKKYPGIRAIAAAALTLLGIGLLTLNNGIISINNGDFLTILCALFFAMHIVAVGHYTEVTDAIVLSIIQLGTAGLFSIFCALIFEPAISSRSVFQTNTLFPLFYLIIFSTMLAFLIQNAAQKYTPPTHAAIILCLESVFGSIFSVLFLGETFSATMIIGCLVIFSAVLLSEIKTSGA